MQQEISIIIVEDHFVQRKKIEELVAKNFPIFNVVSSCGTFKEAQQAIYVHQPLLWLLDVQLDGKNTSIPFLELGTPGSFEVIFLTAETEYVIQNLLSQACATLVKPFSQESFIQAINKALQNIALKKIHSNYESIIREFRNPSTFKDKIAFRNADKTITESDNEDRIDFIHYRKLAWLHSAADHKTNLYYLREENVIPECLPATRSLGEWEGLLKDYGCFERISRSVIINLQFATGYNRVNSKIKLQYTPGNPSNGMEFEVESQYKQGLLQHYNSLIKNPF
jgi:two-component system LytT family response regulator